jgi:hypothetical protein
MSLSRTNLFILYSSICKDECSFTILRRSKLNHENIFKNWFLYLWNLNSIYLVSFSKWRYYFSCWPQSLFNSPFYLIFSIILPSSYIHLPFPFFLHSNLSLTCLYWHSYSIYLQLLIFFGVRSAFSSFLFWWECVAFQSHYFQLLSS